MFLVCSGQYRSKVVQVVGGQGFLVLTHVVESNRWAQFAENINAIYLFLKLMLILIDSQNVMLDRST